MQVKMRERSNPAPPRFTVVGHVGFDVSTRAGSTSRSLGGAGYYATRAAHGTGCQINLATSIGFDFPMESLTFDDVDLSGVVWSDRASPVFTQTYGDDGEICHFQSELGAGASIQDVILDPNSTAVFIATLPPNQQAHFLDRLTSEKAKGFVCIDTHSNYAPYFRENILNAGRNFDILFCNNEEYLALGQPKIPDAMVVVKAGAAGARLAIDGAWYEAPSSAASQVVTLTGAGDVLASRMICGLLEGKGPQDALQFAVDFATYYVESGDAAFIA